MQTGVLPWVLTGRLREHQQSEGLRRVVTLLLVASTRLAIATPVASQSWPSQSLHFGNDKFPFRLNEPQVLSGIVRIKALAFQLSNVCTVATKMLGPARQIRFCLDELVFQGGIRDDL
jgi:hypothetical protein